MGHPSPFLKHTTVSGIPINGPLASRTICFFLSAGILSSVVTWTASDRFRPPGLCPYVLQGVLLVSAIIAGIFYLKFRGLLRLKASLFRFVGAAALGILSAPIGIVAGTLFTLGASVLITPAGPSSRQATDHASLYAVVLLAAVGISAGIVAGICALSVALYILSQKWINVAIRAFVLAGLFCMVMTVSDLILRSNLVHAAGYRSGASHNVQTDILIFGQPLFCAVSGYWLIRSSREEKDQA